MKVAVITFGSILDPRGGTAVRCRATVEALVRLGHAVVVVGTDPKRDARGPALAGVETVPLRSEPFFGFSVELVRRVRRLRADADLFVVENAMFFPAVSVASVRQPIIWDTNECESLHYRRRRRSLGTVLRLVAWRALETLATRRSTVAVAIGDTEKEWWEKLYPALKGRILTVDHAPFVRPAASPPLVGVTGPYVLFVGNLIGKQNADAARWLLNVLLPRLPAGVRLMIAGEGSEALDVDPQDSSRVDRLGQVDDIDTVIAGARLCVAPLSVGAGVKTKVLHYLAHGRPVVATPAAVEGIEDAPGVTVVGLAGFADRVVEALSGSEPPAEVAARQRAWVEARSGPRVLTAQWQAVMNLEDELSRRGRA